MIGGQPAFVASARNNQKPFAAEEIRTDAPARPAVKSGFGTSHTPEQRATQRELQICADEIVATNAPQWQVMCSDRSQNVYGINLTRIRG